MRQWLVRPSLLCDRHLLGEHVEHHMFVGAILRKKNLYTYIRLGFLAPNTLSARHDELVREMLVRGMRHNSPLQAFEYDGVADTVNIHKNINELFNRCAKCRERIQKFFSQEKTTFIP